ncbi:MAG TPA: UrcA family protein [Sphingomicrobium sp.]|nr:UrcA family protein [Sphingomicrobium sp.]
MLAAYFSVIGNSAAPLEFATMTKTLLIAAAMAALVPFGASASEPAERSVAVQTADLDLGTATGQTMLGARIKTAVKTVCGRPNPASQLDQEMTRDCRNSAFISADRQARVIIAQRATGTTLAAR